MKNPYNSQEYEIVEKTRRISLFIKIITVLTFIILVILLCKFNFKTYSKYPLIKENDYYTLYIPVDRIDILNKEIYIDKKKYSYIIENQELININNIIYEKVNIKINNYNSNLNYINSLFLEDNETIINMLIKFTKGGF